MNPERWNQVKDIVGQAQRLPNHEQAMFVDRRCDGDPSLAQAVFELLGSDAAEDFLEAPQLPAAMSDAEPDRPPRRLGDCELIEELGRGGMGHVYRARELSLGRDVAVKVMAGLSALDPSATDRFELEASAAARLEHPCIVRIHHVGRTADDERYIVMELLPGHDLHKEILAQRAARGGPSDATRDGCHLPPHGSAPYMAAVARLCLGLADALALAHEKQLLHRDVKPHNIVLRSDGHPCLVDFGLARDENSAGHTRTGEVRGTPAYMSPEQIMVLDDVDGRTDVYSLGLVLYELLTLRAAFEHGAQPTDLNARVLAGPPLPPRKLTDTVPRDLDTICQRAVQTRREDRYQSMLALRDDLQAFLEHRAIRARPLSLTEHVTRHLFRHRRRYAGGVLAMALLASAVALALASAASDRHDELAADWRHWTERDLRDASGPELLEVDQALRRTLELSAEGRHSDEARRLAERLAIRAAELRQKGVVGIGDALGSERQATRIPLLFDSLGELEIASQLLPGDVELAQLARREHWYPRVRWILHLPAGVTPRQVEAVRRDVDPVWASLGPAVALPADWHEHTTPVPPGLYLFTFSAPGAGHADVTRDLSRWNHTETVEVWLRPNTSAELADMLYVPGGEHTVGFDYSRFPWMRRGPVPIEPFWIDETEVTNLDYLEFVRATGAPRPRHWGDGEYNAELDDLPVIGVTYSQARAYAEWRGKRLPTWVEWDAAARGRNDLKRPAALLGLGPAALADQCLIHRPRPPADGTRTDGEWPGYFDLMQPVGSNPSDASPYGVLDMFGSVTEWTDSPFVTNVNGLPHAELGMRVVKGNNWLSRDHLDWSRPTETSIHSSIVGFRCVRSATSH